MNADNTCLDALSEKVLSAKFEVSNTAFRMNLQSAYKLDLARRQSGKPIQRFPKRSETAEPRPRCVRPLPMMPTRIGDRAGSTNSCCR